jgi:hypothetical protein
MNAKRAHKPVRECHDCELNLGDHCGVYAVPKKMWRARSCPGHKNEAMLRQYQSEQAQHPPDKRKLMRRQVARQRESQPHWQGTMPLAIR